MATKKNVARIPDFEDVHPGAYGNHPLKSSSGKVGDDAQNIQRSRKRTASKDVSKLEESTGTVVKRHPRKKAPAKTLFDEANEFRDAISRIEIGFARTVGKFSGVVTKIESGLRELSEDLAKLRDSVKALTKGVSHLNRVGTPDVADVRRKVRGLSR